MRKDVSSDGSRPRRPCIVKKRASGPDNYKPFLWAVTIDNE